MNRVLFGAFALLNFAAALPHTLACPEPPISKETAAILHSIDTQMVYEFRIAWQLSGGGWEPRETVVLIYRQPDGCLIAKSHASSYEFKRASFRWHPSIAAVVHTHPNCSDPQPSGIDRRTADKLRVPIFTITQNGMYVYDPATRKTSLVMKNLDWLKPSKWNRNQCPLVAE